MTESNQCIFGPLLSPLHDGELSDDRRRDLLEHVRTCDACQTELADIRRFGSVLNAASLPSLSQERADAIFTQSRQIVEAAAVEPTHLRYVRWVSGVAAAVFLLAIGQVVYQRMSPSETNPSMTPNVTEYETPITTNPAPVQDPAPDPLKNPR